MSGVYVFAAAVGVPLALWFVLSGGDDGGDVGSGEGLGGIMFRYLPLSSLAIGLAAFGLTGLLLDAVGTGAITTVVLAVAMAAGAAALTSATFALLRRSESLADVDDQHLTGKIGQVVLPIGPDRRGRVVFDVGGQQRYLSARVPPGSTQILEAGAPVLLIELEAGVAIVARLDPELT